MTIDEAKSYMWNKLKALYESSPVKAFSKDADAYYLAIKALEELKKNEIKQELCEDCISRKAAIDAIWDGVNMDIYTREVKECLEALPPVTPAEKVGSKH